MCQHVSFCKMKLIFIWRHKLDLIIMVLVANRLISYLINYWAVGQGESPLRIVDPYFNQVMAMNKILYFSDKCKTFWRAEGDSVRLHPAKILGWLDDGLWLLTDYCLVSSVTVRRHVPSPPPEKDWMFFFPCHKTSQLKSVQCERAVCDSCICLVIMVW